jgi:hypothetical protein
MLKETILDEEQNPQSDKESQTGPQFVVRQTINLEPIQPSTSGLQRAKQATAPELASTAEVDVAERPTTPQQDEEVNSAVTHKRGISQVSLNSPERAPPVVRRPLKASYNLASYNLRRARKK